MSRARILLRLLLLGAVASAHAADAPAHPFEKEIAAFEAADKTNPPPAHAILFTGSSSIRKWSNLAQAFPKHTVINRGFGGSRISDSIYFFDRFILACHPKLIVFYAGSNDLWGGKKPEAVAADFKTFVQKVEAALPETKIDFISINASPSRWKGVDQVKETNRLISDYIATDPKLAYIDTFAAMLDKDGQPRPELYLKDRLHPNPKGYAMWAPIIAPYLDRAD